MADDPTRIVSRPICDSPDTTTFGIFDTSPESPDGTRICYTRFLKTPDEKNRLPIPGELWVCNRDLSNHRKVTEFEIKPVHNASRASWVDNDRIAFSSKSSICIIDADSGELILGLYEGDLGHHICEHRLLFWSINKDDHDAVYELDIDTGKLRTVVSTEEIQKCFEASIGTLDPFSVKHLQHNPDGTRIGFRLHGPTTEMLTMRSDGSELAVYPTQKPVHQLWFDNDTVMGVWKRTAPKGHDSHYFRWTLEGKVIEELAGPISHGAASPDRMLYAGETCAYFKSPIRMAVYRRGGTQPAAICFDHGFDDITWNRRFHVNPAFSRDGNRLYYWQAVSENKVEARFADLSPLMEMS
jgi:hypothetical protein